MLLKKLSRYTGRKMTVESLIGIVVSLLLQPGQGTQHLPGSIFGISHRKAFKALAGSLQQDRQFQIVMTRLIEKEGTGIRKECAGREDRHHLLFAIVQLSRSRRQHQLQSP